jgi:hypothetical protein
VQWLATRKAIIIVWLSVAGSCVSEQLHSSVRIDSAPAAPSIARLRQPSAQTVDGLAQPIVT